MSIHDKFTYDRAKETAKAKEFNRILMTNPTPQPPTPHPILETMAAPKEGFEWTLIPGENPNCYASWKQRLKQPPERVQALQPTPNVSGTPRTDAAIIESILCTGGGDEECTVYPCVEHVEADFARQLERELALSKYEHGHTLAQRDSIHAQLTAALARAEKAESDFKSLLTHMQP